MRFCGVYAVSGISDTVGVAAGNIWTDISVPTTEYI
jgi:hypothetical protein